MIPSDQGGFAPSNDTTERKIPVHPRLRSLLMGEEEEVEDSLDWKPLSLYTGADHFAPVSEKPKVKSKVSRNRADELFRDRVALSVKPLEEHIGHGPRVDAAWDPMTWATESAEVEAGDLLHTQTLDQSLSKDSSKEADLPFGFGFGYMDENVKTDVKRQWEFCSSEFDFEKLLPDIKAPPLVLRSDGASKEHAFHSTLQASTDEAEKGFNFGLGASMSTSSLPWYESGELISSMLVTDGSALVEQQANNALIADSLTLTASVSDADWSEIAAIASLAPSEH